MIGKQLLQYSVERRLGAGGMGEVYQARDTRLGRSVAVKVLPEAFAQDPERIARLEREAKVLASLNHPNIAALYGLEEFERRHFLVMELVEGETLAQRVARGPVAVDEALEIAQQIAQALEAAHEKTVVHRDLKLANVMITPESKVKVLDFGLAKAMESPAADASLSNAPTLGAAVSNPGVILGTAAYMSPEQANGFQADSRSDIFSFGSVLYEMLTRRQAFQGQTLSEILASVLAREPDFSLLPPKLNPRILSLLRRCLEKNAKRRWQAVGDMRVELEGIMADPRGMFADTLAAPARPLWKRAIPVVVTAVLCLVIGGFAAWNLKPSPPATVTRFPFTLPEGQQFRQLPATGPQLVAISPDGGTQLAYVTNNGVFRKPMDQLDPVYVQGTEIQPGVLNPVFSPDGQSLAFWSGADQTLKRISVSGGAPVTICPADAPSGVTWGPDDEIVLGQGPKGIMRVSANGGKPETIVAPKDDELAHGPQILPGGDAVLFTVLPSRTLGVNRWDAAQIVVQSLGTGERKTVIEGGSDARYVPTGHIIYALSGNLLAVPFDIDRLEVTGGPVPVVEGVRVAGFNTGTAQFSFSDTGTLVYIAGAGTTAPQNRLTLIDRNGSATRLELPPSPYSYPRFSPDGRQLAFGTNDGKEAVVWVYELSGRSSMRRLTFSGNNGVPVWSHDGARVAFTTNREGEQGIFWQRADGTGTPEQLTKAEQGVFHFPEVWTPDGETLFFVTNKTGALDIWTHSLASKKSEPFLVDPVANEAALSLSPDGRWLAYRSTNTGRPEVYVHGFPNAGTKYQITREGGDYPVWSPDGKELFFVNSDRLYSVNVQTQPAFSFGNPVPLPVTGAVIGNGPRQFDISPDGKRFIMLFPPGQTTTGAAPALQIQVVLNWFEELKQRMAAR